MLISFADLTPAMQRRLKARGDVPEGMHFMSTPPGSELKADRKKRTVAGIWNAYGVVDEGSDRTLPGCSKNTIERDGPDGLKRIKMFFEHYLGIGMPVMLREEPTHLYGEARVTDHKDFDKYLACVADGLLGDWSIGFSIVEDREVTEDEKRVREIVELKLYEGSLVYWPMNLLSRVTGMKSAKDVLEQGGALRQALLELSAGTLILDDPDLTHKQALRCRDLLTEIGTRATEAMASLGFTDGGGGEPAPVENVEPGEPSGGDPAELEGALEKALADISRHRETARHVASY